MADRSILIGDALVSYELHYSVRSSFVISVKPDGRVVVKAPAGIVGFDVEAQLQKRGPWIVKHVERIRMRKPTPAVRYVDGEIHKYLGRELTLRVIPERRSSARIVGDELVVECADTANVPAILAKWYRATADDVLPEIARPWIDKISVLGVAPSRITVRTMVSRWGSCSPSGRITLNSELIKTAHECIECVIVHELCHLVHRNHSQEFYDLLGHLLPDWRTRRDKLERGMRLR